MFQRAFVGLLTVCCLTCCARAADVIMDAAEQDRYGTPFSGFAAVRPIVDNTAGPTALSNVRFKIVITSGTLGGLGGWAWADADNPWYGARAPLDYTVGGASYKQGIVYYPPTQDWAPAFSVDPTPGDTEDWWNDYEIFDQVPAGMRWDVCIKISGWLGGNIKLFSTAQGQLTSDQLTQSYYDSDPGPQTVPEPASLCLLISVLWPLAFRRRREPTEGPKNGP